MAITAISTSITADLKYPVFESVVHAKQGDRLTRKIAVNLYNGGAAWTPPADALKCVRFTKEDGTGGYYDIDENGNAAVTVSGSVATVTLVTQVLTYAGIVKMDVDFYTNTTVQQHLSTFSFQIKVEAAACNIDSDDYINVTDGAAKRQCIASDYSSASTYAVGVFCLHNHLLYKCTTAIATAEAWTASHWTAVKVMDVMSDKVSSSVIADDYNSSLTYYEGDYCYYNGDLYRCKSRISTPEAWTASHWLKVTVAKRVSLLDSRASALETNVSTKITMFSTVIDTSSNSVTISSLPANCVQFYKTPLVSLTVSAVSDRSALLFTVGANASITLPSGIIYMDGTPAFTRGKMYYLQFSSLAGSTVSTCFWGEFTPTT